MERWEEEYLDIVEKTKFAQEQRQKVERSYKKGYDSKRWVEIILSDGTKHYVPKDTGRKGRMKREIQGGQRYYSEKVSLVKTILQMIKRLIVLFVVLVVLVVLLQNREDLQRIAVIACLLIAIGVVLYAAYYLVRCLCEGNLRL